LSAAFFLPTLVVPLLLITHGLAFRILLLPQKDFAIRGKAGTRHKVPWPLRGLLFHRCIKGAGSNPPATNLVGIVRVTLTKARATQYDCADSRSSSQAVGVGRWATDGGPTVLR